MNIARGLRTSQSSTPFLPGIGISLTSSLAVDGNKDPNVNHGSCMSTNMSDANPWMSVDFGKPTIVTGFTITNAAMLTEGEQGRRHRWLLWVHVGPTPTFYTWGLQLGTRMRPHLVSALPTIALCATLMSS